jgi:hypothetical protein
VNSQYYVVMKMPTRTARHANFVFPAVIQAITRNASITGRVKVDNEAAEFLPVRGESRSFLAYYLNLCRN